MSPQCTLLCSLLRRHGAEGQELSGTSEGLCAWALHLCLVTEWCFTMCCKLELLGTPNVWCFTVVRVAGCSNSKVLNSSWKNVSVSKSVNHVLLC